jgi:hypothetical protein
MEKSALDSCALSSCGTNGSLTGYAEDCGVKVAIGTRKPNNPAKFILIRRTLINKDCFFVFLDPINPNKKHC